METQASHSSKYYSDIILGYHSYFRVILTMVIVKIHKNCFLYMSIGFPNKRFPH